MVSVCMVTAFLLFLHKDLIGDRCAQNNTRLLPSHLDSQVTVELRIILDRYFYFGDHADLLQVAQQCRVVVCHSFDSGSLIGPQGGEWKGCVRWHDQVHGWN